MKAILTILAIVVFIAQETFAVEPALKLIKVTVAGSVLKPGIKEVALETPLEAILNAAGCHQASWLKQIRVIRTMQGKKTQLIVSSSKEEKDAIEIFSLQDGDIVIVSEILWDPKDEEKPKLVKGPYVLKKEKIKHNKTLHTNP